MKVFNELTDINNIEKTAVALGNFDGVHLGHQKLIAEAVNCGKEQGLAPSVFTFSNHPRDVLSGEKKVKNILYRNEKQQIIESLGVKYMFEIEFTRDIMEMEPEDFVQDILVDKLNAAVVLCGFNFHFGRRGKGDPELMRKLGEEKGFVVKEIEPFCIDGNVVSSSLIRGLVASGEVEKCSKYMGRNYEISGEVVEGNRLGRKLGFPTSNLVIDENMVTPPNGVYITYCDYGDARYPSITNVGNRPTVGDYGKNVETHIFNFDKELYGKRIIVEFLKKTRDEIKFDDVESLSAQIVKDCEEAKAYHDVL